MNPSNSYEFPMNFIGNLKESVRVKSESGWFEEDLESWRGSEGREGIRGTWRDWRGEELIGGKERH